MLLLLSLHVGSVLITKPFKGIVEFSNVCSKDCYYCGIRKHVVVQRFVALASGMVLIS